MYLSKINRKKKYSEGTTVGKEKKSNVNRNSSKKMTKIQNFY